MDKRINIVEYALRLAEVTAYRSEDPHKKVGAVAVDWNHRIIGTGYNGLTPGFVAKDDFWADRECRLKYVLHAEQNLCSLFQRGDVKFVATTLCPCKTCLTLLLAHGVYNVYYREAYHRDQEVTKELAEFYGMTLEHRPVQPMEFTPGEIIHVPGHGTLVFEGSTDVEAEES